MRPIKTAALIAAALMALASTAMAQAPAAELAGSYPKQLVKIVVPFSAGSVTDGLARMIADNGELWKQQVIVENRPGLPGTTGVAKSLSRTATP